MVRISEFDRYSFVTVEEFRTYARIHAGNHRRHAAAAIVQFAFVDVATVVTVAGETYGKSFGIRSEFVSSQTDFATNLADNGRTYTSPAN